MLPMKRYSSLVILSNHRQGLKGDFLFFPVPNGQDQGGPEAQDSYRPFV